MHDDQKSSSDARVRQRQPDDATINQWLNGDTYLGVKCEDEVRVDETRVRLLTDKLGISWEQAWFALNTPFPSRPRP